MGLGVEDDEMHWFMHAAMPEASQLVDWYGRME
jgi:hypothetical protein